MEQKNVIVLNGYGGVGKGEFVKLLSKHCNLKYISIIDKIKHIATQVNWDKGKKQEDRQFLSDLKIIVDKYNDYNFQYVYNEASNFFCDIGVYKGCNLLVIDMREPCDITRFVNLLPFTITCLIKRDKIKQPNNIADKSVFDYSYDYIIENNGSKEDLEKEAITFISTFNINSKFCKEVI